MEWYHASLIDNEWFATSGSEDEWFADLSVAKRPPFIVRHGRIVRSVRFS